MIDCIHLPSTPAPQELVMPGGATLRAQDLIGAAQPALAPLAPLFDILDVVLGIHRVLEAIPDAILGTPPDPTEVAARLAELAGKMPRLLQLVPQFSVPVMAVRLVDAAIGELERARSQLQGILVLLERVRAAAGRGAELGDEDLLRLATCAEEDAATATGNAVRALGAVQGVLSILGPLLALIGGPQLPDLSSLDGQPRDDAVGAIGDLITALRTARDAIPLP